MTGDMAEFSERLTTGYGRPAVDQSVVSTSHGSLLRQLDELDAWAENLSNRLRDQNKTTMTGELEVLQNATRYCFADVGPLAEDALREVAELHFTPPANSLLPGSPLPEEFAMECVEGVSKVAGWIRTVRKRLEGLAPTAASGQVLPERLRKGVYCDQVIQEMRRIKHFVLETGRNIAEVKSEQPGFAVWKLGEHLSEEDRETLDRPNQWGPLVGYAKGILGKFYGRSPHTITDWIKAYREYVKRQSQPPG